MGVEILGVDSDIDMRDDTNLTSSTVSDLERLRSDRDVAEISLSAFGSPVNILNETTIDYSGHSSFHLSVTRTWGNRTLPVDSTEWRDLRSQILIRDDRTCANCKYVCPVPTGRGMKIDHINGDASNNDLANLRVHCPPCEAIRHCGLHGFKGYLLLAKSDMEQIEIVRKTREFFEKYGRIPQVREVDVHASPVDMSMVEFANMLLKVNWDALPEEMKRMRGFFTRKAQEFFSITMLTGGNYQTDSSDRRAQEILDMEASLPWVFFSNEQHGSVQRFLDTNRPSSTKQSEVAWICISSPKSQQDDKETSDVRGLCRAWVDLCNSNRASRSELDILAGRFRVLSGKWLVFASKGSIDDLWFRIARATHAGTLGYSAKVSPDNEAETSGRHVICVYTPDYTNAADVDKVREGLRRLGVKERIGYKPDVYTHCAIYANNRWRIAPTRYHA